MVGGVNLNDVMDECATVLGQVTPHQVLAYPPPTVSPPSGYIAYPEAVEYDLTYGRGVDRIIGLPWVVIVGKANDRAARNAVSGYAAGSGSQSVKAYAEAWNWGSCADLTITKCAFEIITIAEIDYLAAVFLADAAGSGA